MGILVCIYWASGVEVRGRLLQHMHTSLLAVFLVLLQKGCCLCTREIKNCHSSHGNKITLLTRTQTDGKHRLEAQCLSFGQKCFFIPSHATD